MSKGWRRGLIVLGTAALSLGMVAPASAETLTSPPTVTVSCNTTTNVCTETITATLAGVAYEVVIRFTDKDRSGTLTRGDVITSIRVSRA